MQEGIKNCIELYGSISILDKKVRVQYTEFPAKKKRWITLPDTIDIGIFLFAHEALLCLAQFSWFSFLFHAFQCALIPFLHFVDHHPLSGQSRTNFAGCRAGESSR